MLQIPMRLGRRLPYDFSLCVQPSTVASNSATRRICSVTGIDAAPALSIPERVLLFCVASDTDWEHAGIPGTAVTAMIVRGLIQRDAGLLRLTKEGCAVVAALLAKGG